MYDPAPRGVENYCTYCGRILAVLYLAEGAVSEMVVELRQRQLELLCHPFCILVWASHNSPLLDVDVVLVLQCRRPSLNSIYILLQVNFSRKNCGRILHPKMGGGKQLDRIQEYLPLNGSRYGF